MFKMRIIHEVCSKELDEKSFGEDRKRELEVKRISEMDGDSHCEELLDSSAQEDIHESYSNHSYEEVFSEEPETRSVPVKEHIMMDSSAVCTPSSVAEDASVEETGTKENYESFITSLLLKT